MSGLEVRCQHAPRGWSDVVRIHLYRDAVVVFHGYGLETYARDGAHIAAMVNRARCDRQIPVVRMRSDVLS